MAIDNTFFSATRKRNHILAWFLLSLCFVALASWQAQRTLARDLSQQLVAVLPAKLSLALQARLQNDELFQWVAGRLEQDLQTLVPDGGLPLIHSCSVRVIQLYGNSDRSVTANIAVPWQIGSDQHTAQLALDCQFNGLLLLASQSLLALLVVVAAVLLPRPLSPALRARIAVLQQQGVSSALARQLSRSLSDFQMQWLDRALALQPGDVESAVHIARMENRIVFDCPSLQIQLHGIPIKLSKTPFFYYLWYARQRQQGDGWVFNPPVNRPDREGAESLVALMEQHGGHAKSINDLKQNGLRAKTLDQNRNKIRDELISALGENLAAPYLFEAERDLKSGRYRYRLSLSCPQIEIVTN
ncbi:hypothetical protein PVT68_15360 [Microbulbifer bruguierae]|uniref:Uncharacterized protein n=1 Tax=Microbulbifer bruguierae TaxID=3029061 RepID=A0ABY8NBG4_9GAMM|nr:hypothetical protein [Microbulbifer bruguierae]WGL16138.1 hypothetical protein PVT68_15360 [Microbulbifer bruguierae]